MRIHLNNFNLHTLQQCANKQVKHNSNKSAIKLIKSKITTEYTFKKPSENNIHQIEYYNQLSIESTAYPKPVIKLGRSEHIKITSNDTRNMQYIQKDMIKPINNEKPIVFKEDINIVDIAIKSKKGGIIEDTGQIIEMIPIKNGFKIKHLI